MKDLRPRSTTRARSSFVSNWKSGGAARRESVTDSGGTSSVSSSSLCTQLQTLPSDCFSFSTRRTDALSASAYVFRVESSQLRLPLLILPPSPLLIRLLRIHIYPTAFEWKSFSSSSSSTQLHSSGNFSSSSSFSSIYFFLFVFFFFKMHVHPNPLSEKKNVPSPGWFTTNGCPVAPLIGILIDTKVFVLEPSNSNWTTIC